ncbi:MAG: MarR family winged helix-turn-helix transcriptional regulator [Pseudomonadota bacterium]
MEPAFFRLFNEIGILAQLSRAVFEARLPNGMPVSHFSVLNHLIRVGDGPTPLKLSNAFQVPKTTMTHTLSGLEKAGFVEMRPNPDDARSKQVWLTEAGQKFRDEAIMNVSIDMADLKDDFALDRVEKLLPELEELRKIMDARRD